MDTEPNLVDDTTTERASSEIEISVSERIADAVARALDEDVTFLERWPNLHGATSELCTIALEGAEEEATAAIEGLGTIARRHSLAAMADQTIERLTSLSGKFSPELARYQLVMTQIEEALQATRAPE